MLKKCGSSFLDNFDKPNVNWAFYEDIKMKNLINFIQEDWLKYSAKRISKDYRRNINRPFYIGVMGKAGSGKSSIINALCQENVCVTGGVGGCTRTMQEVNVKLGEVNIKLFDFPGIAESQEWDMVYLEIYKSALEWLDMVIWVSKVDDRAMFEDEKFIKENFNNGNSKTNLIFLLSQVDKAEPSREWDYDLNIPSATQKITIEKNQLRIANDLGLHNNYVIGVSNSFYNETFNTYNFDSIVKQILCIFSLSNSINNISFRMSKILNKSLKRLEKILSKF